MIIKFEKLPNDPHLRVVDPTWRGDSTELVVHNELTDMLLKLWGEDVKDGDILTFEISHVPIQAESYMFTKEGKPKSIGGCMYTNPKLGLQYICELLLMYVGPEYPEHFYLRKYEQGRDSE